MTDIKTILGIDGALRNTGYGIITVNKKKIKLLDYGIIHNKQNFSHSKCLYNIVSKLRLILKTFKIDHATIENIFHARNSKTMIILGCVRGAIMITLEEANIPEYSYTPKEIKMSVAGTGNASKLQVARAVSDQLNIHFIDNKYDITDALGVALCHLNFLNKTNSII